MTKSIIAGLLALAPAFVSLGAGAATPTTTGQWSISRSTTSPKVRLELRSEDRSNGVSRWDSSHSAELASLGLTASALDSAGQHVQFTIAREAGSFACDGWAGHGTASGTFVFTPNQAFLDGLRKRGYNDVPQEKLLTAATVDLTLQYVDSIAASGYPNLAFKHLITFRALDVTADSIAGFRRTFGTNVSVEDITSLTALGVTPEYVQEMRSLGLAAPSAREAVELKALGINRAYVDDLAKAGYTKLDARDLVQMKALGVDGSYIRRLADHGLKNLTTSQLVQMKAVGI